MNFLMAIPKYEEEYGFYVGLAYISACLKSRGFNVFCIDLNQSSEPIEKQLSDFINKNKIDVVCTGGMSIHYHQLTMY